MSEWKTGRLEVEYRPLHRRTYIATASGSVIATAGDYLVRDGDGNVWPVDGETFDNVCERFE